MFVLKNGIECTIRLITWLFSAHGHSAWSAFTDFWQFMSL